MAWPLWAALFSASASAAPQLEAPALGGIRIHQHDIESGRFPATDLRAGGLRLFTTVFNRLDGLGDGPVDLLDPSRPGGRSTLQGNGTFARVNGLDAQSCVECHHVGGSYSPGLRFAIGGAGGVSTNAFVLPSIIDIENLTNEGHIAFDGRFVNPPALFGAGALELLAREMTAELAALAEVARRIPNTDVQLATKGTSYGVLRFDSALGEYDTSRVVGIEHDLVVRPFGRKGQFHTVREFVRASLPFHFGLEPEELIGAGMDGDGDGVVDEILTGEVSALHVFITNLESPEIRDFSLVARTGVDSYTAIGCGDCHTGRKYTDGHILTYRYPELIADPAANVYHSADLAAGPAGFVRLPSGGLEVILYSDLKRHDMGPELAESHGTDLDRYFLTAPLWGLADTAPYMHDGRATTITDAILAHGGEAESSRERFKALPEAQKLELLTLLRTLRTPRQPASDLITY